jgi:hypothetical protein
VEEMEKRDDIGFDRLMDWIEGRLTEEEARATEERVERIGDAARADVEWLRAFRKVSERTVLDPLPDEVEDALVERFEAHAEGRRKPGFPHRLLARISFDSRMQPAFGVRSAGTRESRRQLVYATEVADITLDTFSHKRDDRLDLEGQVFPVEDDREGGRGPFGVQLVEGHAEFGTTATDELGAFSFSSVPPGAYELLLGDGEVEIRLPIGELRA